MPKIFGLNIGKKTKKTSPPPAPQNAGEEGIEDLGWAGEEGAPAQAKPLRRKGRSTNILYPVALLAVLGSAGYFYFTNMVQEQSQVKPPEAPAEKALPLPVKKAEEAPPPEPARETATKKVEAAPATAVPAANDKPRLVEALPAPVSKAPATPAAVEAPPKEEPVKPAPAPASGPGSVLKTADVSKVEPSVVPKAAEVPKATPSPVRAAETSQGPYVVHAGVLAQQESLRAVSAKISKLGFDPVHIPLKKNLHFTRLKVGEFSRIDAQAKIRELYVVAPEAFVLKGSQDRVVLYASSHASKEMARKHAALLQAVGIAVDEEEVSSTVEMTLVQFGSFENHAAAEKFAAEARALGLEAEVVKNGRK